MGKKQELYLIGIDLYTRRTLNVLLPIAYSLQLEFSVGAVLEEWTHNSYCGLRNTKINPAGIAGIPSLEAAGFRVITQIVVTVIVFFHIFSFSGKWAILLLVQLSQLGLYKWN